MLDREKWRHYSRTCGRNPGATDASVCEVTALPDTPWTYQERIAEATGTVQSR